MLYNPQWDYSLDSFIAWLETKPRGESYQYDSFTKCAVAQYNAAIGRTYKVPDTAPFLDGLTTEAKIERLASYGRPTFGALRDRAVKLRDNKSNKPWWKFW